MKGKQRWGKIDRAKKSIKNRAHEGTIISKTKQENADGQDSYLKSEKVKRKKS